MKAPQYRGGTEKGRNAFMKRVRIWFLDVEQLVFSKCFGLQSDYWARGIFDTNVLPIKQTHSAFRTKSSTVGNRDGCR